MIAYAEHEFDLGRADKNGTTKRQHLTQVAKQIKRAPEGLLGPTIPIELIYLWNIFKSINVGRDTSDAGPKPLSSTEIKAWCDLYKEELTIWELHILRNLDTAYRSVDHRPVNF